MGRRSPNSLGRAQGESHNGGVDAEAFFDGRGKGQRKRRVEGFLGMSWVTWDRGAKSYYTRTIL